jgi:hypothetical protein
MQADRPAHADEAVILALMGMPSRARGVGVVKWAISVVLSAVAIFTGVLAYGALSNLWADYRDSTIATYIFIGAFCLVMCVLALFGLFLLWGRRRP